MDDAIQALMIAFSALVFVLALSIAIYLIQSVTKTSEYLTYQADSTKFYDNVDLEKRDGESDEAYLERKAEIYKSSIRYVSIETVVPTLYRYCKENFCVKIYSANNKLIQVFDVNLEGKVRTASGDTRSNENSEDDELRQNWAYKNIYNNKDKFFPNTWGNDDTTGYYLFGAPWLGSTENIKARVDLFVKGEKGYINNVEVDYQNNMFANRLKEVEQYKTLDAEGKVIWNNGMTEEEFNKINKFQLSEQFISYSYSGDTMETDEGDVLVTGASSKDKIIIVYKFLQ